MKKTALLLFSIMTAVSITACGSSPNTQQLNSSASESESTVLEGTQSADSSEDIPVIRMSIQQTWTDARDEQEVEDTLNAILAEKYNVKVDFVMLEMANLTTQMNLMLTGGEDAIDLYTSFLYLPMSTLVTNGQAISFDEYLDDNAVETMELLSTYPEEILDCCRIDGKLYALPSINTWAISDLYMVRENVLATDVDLNAVTSVDTLTKALIQLKEGNPDKYFIPGSTYAYFEPKDIDNLGDTNLLGVLTDPVNSTVVENYYESDYFLHFLENVKIWKEYDIISPDAMSNSETNLGSLDNGIVDGTTAYGWDAEANTFSYNNTNPENMAVTTVAITDSIITTGNVTSSLWHISPFCEAPDAAVRLLNAFYTDPECAMLLANGIEGKSYIKTDDGQLDYPKGESNDTVGWITGNAAYLPNSFQLPQWAHNVPDYNEKVIEANQSAQISKALGFVFNSEPVANQMASCSNVVSEYYLPLINAEVDIDEVLPVFQEELKAAGIDEIIMEKQKQLDAWLASK